MLSTNRPWLLTSVCIVGFVLSPLLIGLAPFGGDPVFLYQPLKTELARALMGGRLPFWSDRLGLGVPLIAESHVAAFYPPNWLFYRLLEVRTAYRLTMWLHFVALAAATFAYARALGISSAGSALAGISFALCGFQALHAVHEPFYHVMPFLPFCLLLADRYAVTGRMIYLAGLALAWGAQLALGHFQIQMWTGGLVLATGVWRIWFAAPDLTRRLARIFGLVAGIAWGVAIAWVQLSLTWELTTISSFARPPEFLVNYSFTTGHWAQFALPEVFLGGPSRVGEAYWDQHRTTPGEACAYVGIVPLILAGVGWVGPRRNRDRAFAPWRLIVLVALALATMPEWCPDVFYLILKLPGFGWFRAPARYTLLTSLGLALFAGRGLDHTIAARRFWTGLMLAILFGAAGWFWSIQCAQGADFRAAMRADTLGMRFTVAAVAWVLGLLTIVCWRWNRVGAWALILLSALELGGLFFGGNISWRWMIRLPEASPTLRHLAALPNVGLVAGRLSNLQVAADRTAAYPNLGITPPPPNYLLEPTTLAPGQNAENEQRWQHRFGVSHGVWGAGDDVAGTEVIATFADPALDQLMPSIPGQRSLGPWKLVRHAGAFPAAWVSAAFTRRQVGASSSTRSLAPINGTRHGSSPKTTSRLCQVPPPCPPRSRAGMVRLRSSSTTAPARSS